MKTKNKNYSDYIDNYNESWKATLDIVSEICKLDTLGGCIGSYDGNEFLEIYNHSSEAWKKAERLEKAGLETTVYQYYGPAITIVCKVK